MYLYALFGLKGIMQTTAWLDGLGSWIQPLIDVFQHATQTLTNLVEHTDTPLLRGGIIFLLGILMSLTPCIYPMIPITLGTLQAAGGRSRHNTFLLAFLYTCGMAITFALLGLFAVYGGTQIGALLGNVWFVVPFVAFLCYLAFSMMGLYEIYIPRFLQQHSALSRVGGAYLSAFVFGMINGTVASPCVSPGLLLILSIVATQTSAFLGFIYLFAFGFGLGLPLLIIGSFSQAATIMPRAGAWMLEIKRLFGILLLSMAWYYASNLLSERQELFLASALCVAVIAVYVYILRTTQQRWQQIWSICVILATGALYGVTFSQAVGIYTAQAPTPEKNVWYNQYTQALQEAERSHAWLLVDFGAKWCEACQQLEQHLFHSADILQHPQITYLYIDCSNTNDPYVQHYLKAFNVSGLPTVLLIQPEQEEIIKRWQGGELLAYTPQEFLNMLTHYGIDTTSS